MTIANKSKDLIDLALGQLDAAYMGNLFDTKGFFHLLLGQYKDAIYYLAQAADTNASAKFHLGLLYMIGSKDLYKAEYFFRIASSSAQP